MERLGNKEKRSPRMMTRVAVALLGLLSMGWSAPMNSCTSLIEPITISKEGILGRWLYIGGSSNLPGSRSLGRLLTSVWLEVTAAAESNVLNIIQTQRLYSKCSSLAYNVTFENSTMKIEKPFYLKEVYLETNCSSCLAVYEDIVSGNDTFTSFMLFSRSKTASPDAVEHFKKQAECLRMPAPIMMDPNTELLILLMQKSVHPTSRLRRGSVPSTPCWRPRRGIELPES
ncbi:uncharacterized protein LOC114853238 isoform X2 [Betta splendens]|uniref:Uncharacterized protein LOC114853238 isoform X2 n=1 Tax=Betta splendens TaxID=158456 RepID=A0A9W2XRV2_BETSP|nr:uncharacterized protein LOC114853238 isoform X2 [Betta splendens]